MQQVGPRPPDEQQPEGDGERPRFPWPVLILALVGFSLLVGIWLVSRPPDGEAGTAETLPQEAVAPSPPSGTSPSASAPSPTPGSPTQATATLAADSAPPQANEDDAPTAAAAPDETRPVTETAAPTGALHAGVTGTEATQTPAGNTPSPEPAPLPTVTPTLPPTVSLTRTLAITGSTTLTMSMGNPTFSSSGRPLWTPFDPRRYRLDADQPRVSDRWCKQIGLVHVLVDFTARLNLADASLQVDGTLTLQEDFCDSPGEGAISAPFSLSVPAGHSAPVVQRLVLQESLFKIPNLLDSETAVTVDLDFGNLEP